MNRIQKTDYLSHSVLLSFLWLRVTLTRYGREVQLVNNFHRSGGFGPEGGHAKLDIPVQLRASLDEVTHQPFEVMTFTLRRRQKDD